MCKLRALTTSKPYNLYSGVDAAGSVLFYEPINPYYLILRALCVIYSTAVIIWSMADLAEQSLPYSLWFAFRINWITLLIWTHFSLSLFISIFVNYYKTTSTSLRIPSFTEYDPENNIEEREINFKRLETFSLYRLHQISRTCLQISISAIIFLSILYYMDYNAIFDANAVPEFILNIQTHGILALGLCADFFTSCTQIQYLFGTFLVLFFNAMSLVWTYIFFRADFVNPITHSNVLYPVIDWTKSTNSNFMSIFEVWMAATVSHWFIHMCVVYLKFVVICYWIDRRRFMMDVVDHKNESVKMKQTRIKYSAATKQYEPKRHTLRREHNNKLTNYEFEPLLL